MVPRPDFVIDRSVSGRVTHYVDFRWVVVAFCFSGLGGIILGSMLSQF